MNSYAKPLFSAAILALCFSVTSGNAGILVKGTEAFGEIGDTVKPTFTIDTTDSQGIDVKKIGVWDFELNWDAAALEFKPDASRITVNEIDRSLTEFLAYLEALDPDDSVWNPVWNPILTSGFYRFAWADLSFDPDKQLNIGSSTSSILFTAAFEIESEAVPGTSYDITFGTGLTRSMFVDINEVKASYPSELTPMRVTVQPIPEPGMLGLLLGGMVAYLGAVRLRRSGRG